MSDPVRMHATEDTLHSDQQGSLKSAELTHEYLTQKKLVTTLKKVIVLFKRELLMVYKVARWRKKQEKLQLQK
jgi:hypothetical protein